MNRGILQIITRFSLFLSLLLFFVPFASSQSNYSQLWGTGGELWNSRGRLPDYSYAGYFGGERPIPDVDITASITDFGAIPNDGKDDSQALKNAVNQVNSGAIFFPEGTYRLEDFILIEKSGIVFRGEVVNGELKSIIYVPQSAKDVNPGISGQNYGLTGNFLTFLGRDKGFVGDVVENAKRGDKTIEVQKTGDLVEGGSLVLSMRDESLYGSMFKHFHNDQLDRWDGPSCGWGGPDNSWVFNIEKINGNLITLKEPLAFDIRKEWKPQIWTNRNIQNVGVEDLKIAFKKVPTPGHLGEPGYNGIAFKQVTNGWIRNVEIQDSDNGIMMTDYTSHVTIQDIRLTGRHGHHGISYSFPSFILAQNIHFQTDGNGEWRHALTMDHSAMGCVASKLSGNNTITLDMHKDSPIENLWTEILTTSSHASGGANCAGPHAAARNTYWNLSGVTGIPETHVESWEWVQTNVVTDLDERLPDLLTEEREWLENVTNIYPVNLYTAQLDRRLNSPEESPFSGDYTTGRRALYEERDPSKWRIMDESGNNKYALFYSGSVAPSGNRMGEYSLLKDEYDGDVVLAVDAKTLENPGTNNNADICLILGYQNDRNYYYAKFSANSSETKIYKVKNGNRTDLSAVEQNSREIENQIYYKLRFERKNQKLTFSVDGTVVYAAMDQEFMDGKIGIGSVDDAVAFDNVAVTTDNVFPVELVEFLLEPTLTGIELHWKSAVEVNSSHFEVEKSIDGQVFERIGDVGSQGNSQDLTEYSYLDQEVELNQRYYYRLKLVDQDGTFEYSRVLEGSLDAIGGLRMKIYPNPASEYIQLDTHALESLSYKVVISSSTGSQLMVEEVNQEAGSATQGFDISHLPTGIYHLSVMGDEFVQSSSFIKQ